MELSTILELVKAGFTKDEIMQMAQPQPANADPVPASNPVNVPEPKAKSAVTPAPVAKPVATAVPAPVAKPVATAVPAPVAKPVATAVPAPAPAPAQQEAQPTMAEVMQSIAKLTSAVQANAIAQSVIPAGLSNPPSAEDMLAEIIRPTFKERN